MLPYIAALLLLLLLTMMMKCCTECDALKSHFAALLKVFVDDASSL
jgi:hypothetical protein